jgi:hypothetical protein
MESTEEIIFKTYNNINSKLMIIKKINIVVVVVLALLALGSASSIKI